MLEPSELTFAGQGRINPHLGDILRAARGNSNGVNVTFGGVTFHVGTFAVGETVVDSFNAAKDAMVKSQGEKSPVKSTKSS